MIILNVAIITSIISVCAALSGMILGWRAKAKEQRKEIQSETEAATKLQMDMEYIKRGVDDVRVELRSQGQRIDSLTERLIRVEESAKQAHKRLDQIETRERVI